MVTVINFKTDKKIKSEAQQIAKKMGLTISDVLNVFLRNFVRDKELNISLEEPSDWLLKQLAESKEDIKQGRVSPAFSNAKEAIKWLRGKNRKHECKIQQ